MRVWTLTVDLRVLFKKGVDAFLQPQPQVSSKKHIHILNREEYSFTSIPAGSISNDDDIS